MSFMVRIFDISIGFPGAFYFITGVAISLLLFSKDVATLGILLVSVGDPTAAIFGIFFSKSKKIWGKKNYAGTIGSATVFTIFSLIYSPMSGNKILEIYGITQTILRNNIFSNDLVLGRIIG